MRYYESLFQITCRNKQGSDLTPFTGNVAKGVKVIMKTDGTEHLCYAGSAGGANTGFIYHTIEDEKLGAVVLSGMVLAMSGGAISSGAPVKLGTTGKVVTGGLFADSCGLALSDASGADEAIWISLDRR